MFNILEKNTSDGKVLAITNEASTATASIFLEKGGSLQQLKLDGIPIIEDLHPLTYDTTYASALLFPFVGRTAEGKYTFGDIDYQFALNDGQNALHGLLYNKEFEFLNAELLTDKAVISLVYNETEKSSGFPFLYKVAVTYTITENELNLQFKVTNTGNKPFPFNVGWHPYFKSSNLSESKLHFKSSQAVEMNAAILPEKIKKIKPLATLPIKDQQFDDCFVLDDNHIAFETPRYKLHINSGPSVRYLQIYTPPKENVIAIEPQTATANSFNNSWGLKTLEPGASFSLAWQLSLEKST